MVKLLINSALVAKLLTDYPDAEFRLNRAASLAETVGQAEMKNRVLTEKAGLYYQWGRLDEGLALAERVISAGGTEYSENQASAWNASGNIHLRRCSFGPAEECFLQALEHYQKLGMDTSVGIVRNNLANIHNIQGNYPRAMELYRQALDCFEKQNDIFRTAHVLYSMGQIVLALKDTAQAKSLLKRSLALGRMVQDYRGITNNLLMQFGILTDERDFDGARELLRQADQVMMEHKLTDPHLKAYRDGETGLFHFAAGKYDLAEICLLRLIELSQKMKESSFLSRGYSFLGKTRVFKNGNEEGIADIKKGIELAESGDLPLELKDGWTYLVECYCRLGKTELAELAAQSYVREAIKQGNLREKAEAEITRYLSPNKNTINK
ncbi:tetratricopeptide repeat protein [candidate division TA06 bacterium]|uniref:Tetratricopeptide repeat protein n=1 Tax=candidate division TA06 bacterium TaxID=2250710 RepID=A0A933MLI7_UNCT6|nr:tetratricopeptide repeat protein [candidate division TA06 bacterium]